jgi:hemerythrin-like domain-containing protein
VTTNQSPIDTHDMILIHRVIRREIGQLPEILRGAAGDPARSRLIAAHATEMLDFLHVHHSGEDELLYPLLRERVTLDRDLIDRMEAQHAEVAGAIDEVRAALPQWSTSADADVAEQLAARVEAMMPVLHEHLREEEELILPIVAVNISQDEWAALGKHGFGAVPGKRRLVMLGYIIEETNDTERRRFMLNVPPPARLAYKVIGRRQFAKETAQIRR